MQFGLLYEMQRPFEGTSVDWNTLYKETIEQCAAAGADVFVAGSAVYGAESAAAAVDDLRALAARHAHG